GLHRGKLLVSFDSPCDFHPADRLGSLHLKSRLRRPERRKNRRWRALAEPLDAGEVPSRIPRALDWYNGGQPETPGGRFHPWRSHLRHVDNGSPLHSPMTSWREWGRCEA